MSLFRGWQNAGPGIDPNAPKKKPFFRFWELLFRNFGKLITLNLVFSVLHIPMFLSLIVYIDTNNKFTNAMTIFLLIVQFLIEGPVMAGCARILRLIVLDKPFFFGEEFKKGFKNNFGAALLYWCIDAVLIASIIAGYYVYPQIALESGSSAIYIPYGISLAIALIVLFMNYYILPLQAATTLNKRNVLKNAFMLVGLSLKQCIITTLGAAAMIGLMVLLIFIHSYFMFLLSFFPAAFIGYLVMFVHYPVIQKYVINPYYEASGEQNPEDDHTNDDEDRLFTDRGGSETPAPVEKPKKGKVIS
ncbi:MAG TPA: hypothetical protein DCG49_02070 [Ruminococcus sp.]|nr:hypothetical protein [Ruminococcus sp.]